MRIGLVLALVATFGGFALGGVFGGLEHESHNVLATRARTVLASVYHGDESLMAAGERSAWTFWKRAHLHASAMGTSAVLLTALMVFVPSPGRWRMLASLGAGLGAVGYAGFLLLAGWRCPVIGDAYATKQSVAWLAIPSAGAYLMGTLAAMGIVGRGLFAPAESLTRRGAKSARAAGDARVREIKPRSNGGANEVAVGAAPALASAGRGGRSRS